MICDAELIFDEDFAVTGISSSNKYIHKTAASSVGIDMGIGTDGWGTAKTPDIGESGDLDLLIVCVTDFASSGSPAITIDLHASASSSMGTPDTLLTVVTDKTPNDGDVILRAPIPKGTTKRYLDVNVAVATAVMSAGKIWAGLVRRSETPKYDA